jgi:uncharacterized membrane protein YccC
VDLTRFRKLIGTIVGGILGLGVGAILAAAGVVLAPVLVALITIVLGAIGTYVAPANAEKGDDAHETVTYLQK